MITELSRDITIPSEAIGEINSGNGDFEKLRLNSLQEHYDAVFDGKACPVIPGFTINDFDFRDLTENTLNNHKKRSEEINRVILDIARNYKKVLSSSGVAQEKIEAAYDKIIDKGFNAVNDRNPRAASRALTEPIRFIVGSERCQKKQSAA